VEDSGQNLGRLARPGESGKASPRAEDGRAISRRMKKISPRRLEREKVRLGHFVQKRHISDNHSDLQLVVPKKAERPELPVHAQSSRDSEWCNCTMLQFSISPAQIGLSDRGNPIQACAALLHREFGAIPRSPPRLPWKNKRNNP